MEDDDNQDDEEMAKLDNNPNQQDYENVIPNTRITTTRMKFNLDRLIGKGSFAKVYVCTCDATGIIYALKKIPKKSYFTTTTTTTTTNTATTTSQQVQEILIHKQMKHEHICQIIHTFQDNKYLYML